MNCDPHCRFCREPLGSRHRPGCAYEYQVCPSECDGVIEAAKRAVGLKADYERGIAEGERRERAAVVKWLRQRLVWACAPIEAGEHTKEGA